MSNSLFNYIGTPNPAFSVGQLMEKEEQKAKKELQKEERERQRDKAAEEYNLKSLKLAEESKLLSEKSIKFSKIAILIGFFTLVISTIGTIFTILSCFS